MAPEDELSGEPQLIQIPAQMVSINSKADRSWKLVFETQELDGDDVRVLGNNIHGTGWLVYKPNAEVMLKDIPEGYADPGVKSPSQRLRSNLFILWKQKGSKGDFESYYRTSVEKLINIIQQQLDKEA